MRWVSGAFFRVDMRQEDGAGRVECQPEGQRPRRIRETTDEAADCLLDLVFALKAPYRRRARFVMNRLTQAAVRKLKNDDGDYLWQPALGAELASTLLGYPVTECEEMPDIAAGSMALAFGDFERGYLVVDRAGINVLRDPFTAKPYVLFCTTKRVGGGVQDFDAIKLLKFAAS